MRLFFSSSNAFKRAAKQLTSSHKLTERQNLLAKACGYRDYHDLCKSLSTQDAVRRQQQTYDADDWAQLVVTIAELLSTQYGDTLYELTQARVIPKPWQSGQGAVDLRAKVFELAEIPVRSEWTPGAVIRMRPEGESRSTPGYFLRYDEFSDIVEFISNSCGFPNRAARFECHIPRPPLRPFIPTGLFEPYGYITKDDGTKIVFSREYWALWKVEPAKAPKRILPYKIIMSHPAKWFSKPGRTLTPEQAAPPNALKDLRLIGVPRLVDILPRLIANNCNFEDAVNTYLKSVERMPSALASQ